MSVATRKVWKPLVDTGIGVNTALAPVRLGNISMGQYSGLKLAVSIRAKNGTSITVAVSELLPDGTVAQISTTTISATGSSLITIAPGIDNTAPQYNKALGNEIVIDITFTAITTIEYAVWYTLLP